MLVHFQVYFFSMSRTSTPTDFFQHETNWPSTELSKQVVDTLYSSTFVGDFLVNKTIYF